MPQRTAAQSPSSSSATPPVLTAADLPAELRRALDVAIDKSARAPVILNVTEIAGYTDWVLIVSGRSDRHVAAIADGIERALRGEGTKPQGSDGFSDHSWDLIDYDDFMVHVFVHPARMHYDLESMWSDAPRVELELPDEVMDTSDLEVPGEPGAMPEYRGDFVFGGFEDEFDDDDDPAHEAPEPPDAD